MEINITHFFNTCAPMDYSASRVEIGDNAGPITWWHACEDSTDFMMLDDEEKREAFRENIRGFGAWDDAEINAWSNVELNALLIQCVSGDIREAGIDTQNPAWEEYELGSQQGTYAGRLFKGVDSEIYYYIGD